MPSGPSTASGMGVPVPAIMRKIAVWSTLRKRAVREASRGAVVERTGAEHPDQGDRTDGGGDGGGADGALTTETVPSTAATPGRGARRHAVAA